MVYETPCSFEKFPITHISLLMSFFTPVKQSLDYTARHSINREN